MPLAASSILGSTGSIGTQALDVVERVRGPRARRPVGRALAGRRWSRRPERHGVTRIALADADAAARAAEAWTDGEVLAGPEGLVRLVVESGRRPRAQRARRLGRPGADGRDAGRGDRPRAGQQGVARRRRRARHAARRGDRRADPARRLRALGAAPAAAPASGPGTVDAARRSPPPAARSAGARARRAGGRDRRGGARAPDVGHGRQDHHRLGDADEQGPGGHRGPPPVRHAATTGIDVVVHPQSIVHALRARCATAPRSRTSGHPDMRVPISYALHHPERVDVADAAARPRRGRRR